MNWFNEYKSSLKNIHAEELLDIYFFRPLAFVIVKTLYPLPLTPNQYSLMSFLSGMTAGYFFFAGQFELGALFFLLFAVLDCCDGMQARMKKNGTEFGRIIDGIVDYVSNIVCYVALAIGVSKHMPYIGLIPTSVLVILAGFSKALHSIMYDHYLMEYLSYDKGESGFVEKELEILKKKREEAQKMSPRPYLRLIMLNVYIAFSSMQSSKEKTKKMYEPKAYVAKNLLAIRLWGGIGPAVHILAMVVAFLFNRPEILFYYAILFANLWMIGMLMYQAKIHHDLTAMEKAEV